MKSPRFFVRLITALAAMAATIGCAEANNQPPSFSSNEPAHMNASTQREVATLGGGCFWCIEAVFELVDGVVSVESGYTGGSVKDPSYKQVCEGTTGHAEVCRVTFDPAIVSYADILQIFFAAHDPTTLNRQGNDVGTQYRSAIYTHSQEQDSISRQYIRQLTESKTWPDPIVTEVSPASAFYKAEDYHQNYYEQNGSQPYCAFVVRPKVEKFKKQFKDKLRDDAR
jgi:peptide-methionine (S)-S-oxide reductase